LVGVYHGLIWNERRHIALPIFPFLLHFLKRRWRHIICALHSPSRLLPCPDTPLLGPTVPRLCFTVTLSPCSTRTRCRLYEHLPQLTSALPHLYSGGASAIVGLTFTSRTSSLLGGRASNTCRSATRKQPSLIRYTGCVRITKHSHRNTTRLRTPLPALTNRPPRLTLPLSAIHRHYAPQATHLLDNQASARTTHCRNTRTAMHLLLTSLLLAQLAQFTAATDISLSSFTPRIDNLPSACRAVYTTPIDGCAASDFAAAATCSVQCLGGLVRIGVSVKTGCRDVDVGETSIIGVFQNGLGVAALCPNNKQSTSTSEASSTTTAKSETAKSTLQTSTSTRSSEQATTTASPPPSSAQSSTAPSSSGIAIDTTATQAPSTTFQFNDPTAAPIQTLEVEARLTSWLQAQRDRREAP
jgi:hypothetical protein